MRRGWNLRYGFRFRDGKRQFYIYKSYKIGRFICWEEEVSVDTDTADRIAELIKSRSSVEEKE